MTREDSRGMLDRGLIILTALGEQPDGMALSEVVRAVDLPVSTAHRLLNIAVGHGFAAFDKATKRYTLGVKIFELAGRIRSVQSLSQVARPIMRELVDLTGETLQLAVLAENSAMFVEKLGADRSITIRGSVGQREPLYATSTGKVMLAALPESVREQVISELDLTAWTEHTIISRPALLEHIHQVAEQGWAVADDEYDRDVRALAVPIRNPSNTVVAALCVAGPKYRIGAEALQGWLPELQEAAHSIGVQLPPDAR